MVGHHAGQTMELEQMNVILKIPRDAARLTISAVILDDDGSPVTLEGVFNPDDIRQARQDFLDNVEGGDDYDVRYVLTDEGRAYLEQLEKERD